MYVREFRSDPRAREKPCLRCGRSLRKNLDDRHCPDCGLSVWMSLNANDSLAYSNADWLRKAARGAWVMAAIQLVAYAAYFVALAGMLSSTVGVMQSIAATAERHAARRSSTTLPATPTATTSTAPTTNATASNHPPADEADEADWEEAEGDVFGTLGPRMLAVAAGVGGVYFIPGGGGARALAPPRQRGPGPGETVPPPGRPGGGGV